MNRSAFAALTRLGFGRLLDDDLIGAEGNDTSRLAQVLALLSVPGAFHSIYVALHYSVFNVEAFRLPLGMVDRYSFVCYSMVVMGFAAVIQWQALFPDKRDFLILTPLPISTPRMFVAKLLALMMYVGLFGFAANACSTILFPMVSASKVNFRDFLQIVAAHAFAVTSVGVFVAFSLGASQGILLNLVSPPVFRVLSEWLRIALVAFLTACTLVLPFLSFIVPTLVDKQHSLLYLLPPFWFLGLYETLLPGHTGNVVFYSLASIAWKALALSGITFLLTYLAAYRKHSGSVLEESVSGAQCSRAPLRWLSGPLELAAFDFVNKTMNRSAKHRLCLAAFAGIALALCLLTAHDIVLRADGIHVSLSEAGLRSVPLIVSFFIITGVRSAFSIPAELRANWMFQVSVDDATDLFRGLRKWLAWKVILPLTLLATVYAAAMFPTGLAVSRIAFDLLLTILLAEILWRRITTFPFTSSSSRMSWNCVGTLTIYVAVLWLFAFKSVESPWLVLLCFSSAALLIRFWSQQEENGLIFDEEPDPAVRTLNLRYES